MEKLEQLKKNEVLKEIIADSFGGIMYDSANKNKYNTKELLNLWDSLDGGEKGSVGGIIKGAIQFIRGD